MRRGTGHEGEGTSCGNGDRLVPPASCPVPRPAIHAVTPGEGRRGEGATIAYGVHATPFGDAFVARTERGVCALAFLDADGARSESAALADLAAAWPAATLRADAGAAADVVARTFAPHAAAAAPLALHLRGTPFQVTVWEALLRVPAGAVVSYEELAAALGRPSATRAVASAVARNPVGYLVPCHRVIRKSGAPGEYRWGAPRKRAMLAWERALRTAAAAGQPGRATAAAETPPPAAS